MTKQPLKRTFRVTRQYPHILRNRRARIQRRLAPRNGSDQPQPRLRGGNLHYELGGRAGAVGCGGVGVLHTLVQRLGLVEDIDAHLHLHKVHLPYHESDHVLNIAYNLLAGGVRLEDIEWRRQDEHFLHGLGACWETALPPKCGSRFAASMRIPSAGVCRRRMCGAVRRAGVPLQRALHD